MRFQEIRPLFATVPLHMDISYSRPLKFEAMVKALCRQ